MSTLKMLIPLNPFKLHCPNFSKQSFHSTPYTYNMTKFLEAVAESLTLKIGTDLPHTIVIFPNKRASQQLNRFLVEQQKSVWAPRYMTISELFLSLTDLKQDDPINTVCRIYRIYKEFNPKAESLDLFYGWGERILADFDDLDKNMGDAHAILHDLKEYQEIGNEKSPLTDEQIEQLKKFLVDFSKEKDTEIRRRFLELWRTLYPIYERLHMELQAEGLGYEGMIYRQVVESLESGEISLNDDIHKVVFVGFNVLDKVEERLFSILRDQGKAMFFWDYDEHYTFAEDSVISEAGTFLRKNLKEFPNELSDHSDLFRNLGYTENGHKPFHIAYVSSDTDAIQAQYVKKWLKEEEKDQSDEVNNAQEPCSKKPKYLHIDPKTAYNTAIVLCNETMLQPVLYALPEKIYDEAKRRDYEVNVTKGFPMGHTPAYSFIVKLINLLLSSSRTAASFQENPLPQLSLQPTQQEMVSTLLFLQKQTEQKAIEVKLQQQLNEWDRILYTEAYFQVYTTLNRFIKLVGDGLLANASGISNMGYTTLFRLLIQELRKVSIPFKGDPFIGLQVMGVLETRCLDFDHILMLNVGEGILPQKATDASFIPFLIRKRYGLTTFERKNAVYAYYFFRLIQRAQSVTMLYNESTQGSQKGEMSRFMRAMLIDDQIKAHISRYSITSDAMPSDPLPSLEIETGKDWADRIKKMSPSKLKKYIQCKRAFYYEYIKGIRVEPTNEGFIAPRFFGNILHSTAQHVYDKIAGENQGLVSQSLIKKYLSKEKEVELLQMLKEQYAKEEGAEYNKVAEAALYRTLRLLLSYEAGLKSNDEKPVESFDLLASEYKIKDEDGGGLRYNIPREGLPPVEVVMNGSIDRLDVAHLADGSQCLRVIDYKTGGNAVGVKSRSKGRSKNSETIDALDTLFHEMTKDQPANELQTLIYCLIAYKDRQLSKYHNLPIRPALYYIQHMTRKDFNPYLETDNGRLTDFRAIALDFEAKLKEILKEMLDPNNPFEKCEKSEKKDGCKFCDYKELCENDS